MFSKKIVPTKNISKDHFIIENNEEYAGQSCFIRFMEC